ncbi:MAG: hypothetical protein ACODAU_00795 [Myxococcota bacterium]
MGCLETAYDGGFAVDAGVGLTVEQCAESCTVGYANVGSACQEAIDAWAACLEDLACTEDTSECQQEGDALDTACEGADPVPF